MGLGLAVLGIALVGRLTTSTAVTFGLDFNLKEKLFVSISWIPKGTVQVKLLILKLAFSSDGKTLKTEAIIKTRKKELNV